MASEPCITWEKKERQIPDFCCSIFSEEMMAVFLRSTSKPAALAGRAVPGGGCGAGREFFVQSPLKLSPALCSATQHCSSTLQQELWQKSLSRNLRFSGFAWLWERLLHQFIRAAPPVLGCAAVSGWAQTLGSPAALGHGTGDTASEVALEPGAAPAPLPCFLWQLLQSLYLYQQFTPLGFQASQFSDLERKKKLKKFIIIEMSRARFQCKY